MKVGEGNDWGWDGWMASPTQWTWIWVNSGSWWWTGRPGWCSTVHGVTKSWTWLSNWTELNWIWRTSISKVPTWPKAIYRINTIVTKIPMGFFFQINKKKKKGLKFMRVRALVMSNALWPQGFLPLEFSRQEYWSGNHSLWRGSSW